MKVLSLTVNEFTGGLENVIEFVHWQHEGITSSTKLSPPKKIFKPLAEVTEEQIIAWVWGQDRAKIEKFLSNKKIAATVEFGSVPEPSEEAENAKRDYWVDWATKRLAQHVLLEGRPEVKEMQPTGEQVFNEETSEMEDVLAEVVVQTAIDPVAEFVDQTTYTEEGEAVTESVRNPVIVEDEAERAKAVEILETYNDR
jgi:hypothetical protein